jgi:hypothetical protein
MLDREGAQILRDYYGRSADAFTTSGDTASGRVCARKTRSTCDRPSGWAEYPAELQDQGQQLQHQAPELADRRALVRQQRAREA